MRSSPPPPEAEPPGRPASHWSKGLPPHTCVQPEIPPGLPPRPLAAPLQPTPWAGSGHFQGRELKQAILCSKLCYRFPALTVRSKWASTAGYSLAFPPSPSALRTLPHPHPSPAEQDRPLLLPFPCCRQGRSRRGLAHSTPLPSLPPRPSALLPETPAPHHTGVLESSSLSQAARGSGVHGGAGRGRALSGAAHSPRR